MGPPMSDEFIEEMAVRAAQEKMDKAFRAAMQKAIQAGKEFVPTVVSKAPGTLRPKVVFAL